MMSLWLRHQARAAQRGDQQNYRRGGCIGDSRARGQHIRRARPYKQPIETRGKKGQSIDSRDGCELHEAQICGRGIAKQIPWKTDFRQMGPRKFECHPEKRRTQACQVDALEGPPVDGPGKTAAKYSPGNSDQQQETPSACQRDAAVDGENRRNPRQCRQDEERSVNKPATECHAGTRAEQGNKENRNANPGVDAEVETGVGERKRSAGNGGDNKTKARRNFRSGLRAKIGEPTAPRHQCFTMALKPASSRPFLAASAAFGSAYGPTCTR